MRVDSLDALVDALEQLARDQRRAAVTRVLLWDSDNGDEGLADRLDRDDARFTAEMEQWRVTARQHLARLSLPFPLVVDWDTRPHRD